MINLKKKLTESCLVLGIIIVLGCSEQSKNSNQQKDLQNLTPDHEFNDDSGRKASGNTESIPTLSSVSLPPAKNVLPADEVSGESLVVIEKDFRFQIPPEFKHIEHPRSQVAYQGIEKGLIEDANVTIYVTREPFSNDLNKLVNREKEALIKKGGDLSKFKERSSEISILIAGKMNPAYRLWANIDGNLQMQVLAVHNNYAYFFYCETPYKVTAWANVGSFCMIRGATFHVAPPN